MDKKNNKIIELFASQEVDYENQLQHNPKQLFRAISLERIHLWEEFLFSNQNQQKSINQYESDFHLIDDIFLTELNEKNQSIIHTDCIRTRIKESKLIHSFLNTLEQNITYYCNSKGIVYKQGLNEIFAPFLLLKFSLTIQYDELYNLSCAFIDKFLTNYFREVGFKSLHSSLSLLVLLLKYHLPSIYNILEANMISSEMYGTSWIMTALGRKLKLDCLYHLWDHLIRINDPIFLHFVIVAMLQLKKDIIESCNESVLPVAINQISMNTIEEVDTVMQIALELRTNTPYSFRILSNRLHIFDIEGLDLLKKAYETYSPNDMLAMPMFPSEVFFITYRKYIKCPDNQCVYNKFSNEDQQMQKKAICEHCDLDQYKTINYVLLDLRIITNGHIEECASFLPMMIMVPQNELKTDDFHDHFADRFKKDKGRYHFILLTNQTNYFKEYEKEFYSQSQSPINNFNIPNFKSSTEQSPTKIDMTLLKTLSQDKIFKLKEYDNLKRSILSFVNGNYPYISYIEGGFEAIHDESFKSIQTSLLNHTLNCSLCIEKKIQLLSVNQNESKGLFSSKKNCVKLNEVKNTNTALSKSLWERKKKMKFSEVSFLNTHSYYTIKHCVLKEYDNIKQRDLSIIVIVNPSDLLIYQKEIELEKEKEKKTLINKNNNSDNKELLLIKYIELLNITSIRMKKVLKRIVTIKYNEEADLVSSVIIDFINDDDSKLLIDTVKKYTKQF